MNIKTKKSYCERRAKNVQKIEDAINLLERQIKDCIIKEGCTDDNKVKEKMEKEIALYTKLLSGAVIIWSETLIKTLFHEHGAFEEEQLYKLMDKSLNEKWKNALICAFYKSFSNVPYNSNNPLPSKSMVTNLPTIDVSKKDKFLVLYDLITTKLEPAIAVRNKIQHGDWVYSFKDVKFEKNSVTNILELKRKPAFDRKLTSDVENENLLILHLKRNQFRAIYGLIKDLAVFRRFGAFRSDNSKTPFEFNFDKRYRQILSNQKHIDNADFDKYRNELVASTKRGKQWIDKQKPKSLFEKITFFLKNLPKFIQKITHYRPK